MYDVRLPNIDWLGQRGDLDRMLNTDPKTEQGLIMFYGDSGFTRWSERHKHRPLEEDIRHKDGSRAAVNHGFGTSTAEEQLYNYSKLVKPWAPRALVLLALGNDMAAGYSAEEVMFLQARILDYARHDFPGIKLYLCNRRPILKTPSAAGVSIIEEYNELVSAYCQRHEDTTLVDHKDCPELWEPGHAGEVGHVRSDIFVEDEVHFNQKGYDIYRDFFLRVLDDLL